MVLDEEGYGKNADKWVRKTESTMNKGRQKSKENKKSKKSGWVQALLQDTAARQPRYALPWMAS